MSDSWGSETSGGPGWWLASDGRWYPPSEPPGLATSSIPDMNTPVPSYGSGPDSSARRRLPRAAKWLIGGIVGLVALAGVGSLGDKTDHKPASTNTTVESTSTSASTTSSTASTSTAPTTSTTAPSPAPTAEPPVDSSTIAPTAPVAEPAEVPPVSDAPTGGVYFATCAAARAAGAAPLHVGGPGYRPALDRDKDGVACES